MDLRICGTIILAICAICGTVLFCKKLENQHTETMTWAAAFNRRCEDRNKEERKNWSDANCDLVGQIELLRAENERLVKENERIRSVMARVKVAEL